MRGGDRKSKSINELKAQGTYRADRHANRVKATPAADIAAPPDRFDKAHVAKWYEVCKHLKDFEILAVQDYDSIVTYVETTLMQRNAIIDVQQNGMSIEVETKFGTVTRVNPAWTVYKECEAIIKPLREQFGFTPRARQGIKVKEAEPDKKDPLAALLSKFN